MTNQNTSLERKVQTLLESQQLGVLATCGPSGAHASLVAFASSSDLQNLLFATPKTTRKFNNLSRDPRVSLLVDNRSNRHSDCYRAFAATAYGRADALDKATRTPWLELYLAKQPHLVDFVRAESCVLVLVTVKSYSVVEAFQRVSDLELNP